MILAGQWIELAAFIERQKRDSKFTLAMRASVRTVELQGREATIQAQYLDQAHNLTSAFPMFLNAWSGHEREIAQFLEREKPFGETVILKSRPISESIPAKEKSGNSRKRTGGNALQRAFSAIDAIVAKKAA